MSDNTLPHWDTLPYDATRYNTLQCTATRCNTRHSAWARRRFDMLHDLFLPHITSSMRYESDMNHSCISRPHVFIALTQTGDFMTSLFTMFQVVSKLLYGTLCCSVLQGAACCSVLQRVVVSCRVLQCDGSISSCAHVFLTHASTHWTRVNTKNAHVHTYTHIHAHRHTCAHTHTHTHTHIHTHTYTHIHTHTHTHTLTGKHTCTHAHTHTRAHTHTLSTTHTHTHTHTHIRDISNSNINISLRMYIYIYI